MHRGDAYYGVKHSSLTELGSNWADFMGDAVDYDTLVNAPTPDLAEYDIALQKGTVVDMVFTGTRTQLQRPQTKEYRK